MWIDEELWKKIKEVMPILCVDLLVDSGGAIPYVLLCLRNNEPEKGRWWLPGGRIHKGETLVEASRRIAKGELGLLTYGEKQIYTFDYISKEGKHTPVVLHKVSYTPGQKIILDSQHRDHKWVPLTEACDAVSYLGTWGWTVITGRWT